MDFHVTLRDCDMKKYGIFFSLISEEMMITRIDIGRDKNAGIFFFNLSKKLLYQLMVLLLG